MKTKFYLPTQIAQRVTWLNTFSANLATHAATLAIAPAELALIVVMAAYYSYIVALIDLSKKFTQSLTKFKNNLSNAALGTVIGAVPVLTITVAPPPPATIGIFTYISGLVQRIKGHPNYTPAIGENLGIIGAEQLPFDEINFKPTGKGESRMSYVNIDYFKDQSDSMNVYGVDGAVLTYLGNDKDTPWHDTRPLHVAGQPENRTYVLHAVKHDIEIGKPSDPIVVTFAG